MYMYLLGPFYVDPIISHATIGRLRTKPASYWSNRISVITFCKYENNKNTNKKSRHFRKFRNPGWEKKRIYGDPVIYSLFNMMVKMAEP